MPCLEVKNAAQRALEAKFSMYWRAFFQPRSNLPIHTVAGSVSSGDERPRRTPTTRITTPPPRRWHSNRGQQTSAGRSTLSSIPWCPHARGQTPTVSVSTTFFEWTPHARVCQCVASLPRMGAQQLKTNRFGHKCLRVTLLPASRPSKLTETPKGPNANNVGVDRPNGL